MLDAAGAGAAANTPGRSPAEELEAELAKQVKIPEPELVVVTDGPDPARFDLVEGTVELDGRALPGPVEPGWGKPFFRGPVVPGNHVLTAQFTYRGSRTGAYPWSGSFVYRVPGKVEFQAQRGLRLVVHLRVEVHEEQEDSRNRLAFRAALETEMTATVDDAPMPPPPPQGPDAGGAVQAGARPVPDLGPGDGPRRRRPRRRRRRRRRPPSPRGASLDVATARLQKAIATPAPAPPPKTGKTGSSGKSSRSKGLPDAGPLQD